MTKMAAEKRRLFILQHMGLMPYDQMAKQLGVVHTTIYKDLAVIRKERDLIHHELVKSTAEEQYNRMNTSAKLAFNELMNHRAAIHRNEQTDRPFGSAEARARSAQLDRELKSMRVRTAGLARTHADAERTLTHFLKAVGVYNPDLILQAAIDKSINLIVTPIGPDVPPVDVIDVEADDVEAVDGLAEVEDEP